MPDSSSNNATASAMHNTHVTRPVFAKYFLQVLTETSNLTISYEESNAMFDELACGNKSLNEINMNNFYTSSMSEFLSDSQILQLIKEFKALKAEVNESSDPSITGGSDRRAGISNRRTSTSLNALRNSRRPSTMSLEITTSVDELRGRDRRRSIVSVASSAQPTTTKSTIIEREFFIQNYPQLLMDVMLE